MNERGGADPVQTERFVIRRTLGAGGMGVVYEAFDRERDENVALKALRHMDPASLYRFKREFRALADLAHPNLVGLYELFSIGDDWFFTMELVLGTSFLGYVRPDDGEPRDTDVDVTAPTGPLGDDAAPRTAPGSAGTLPDFDRLQRCLEQLVHGLCALHATGRLHRDIKPSNVLCTPEGRVVICDFGLVTEPSGQRTDAEADRVVGTALYMSPEQAAGLALGEASDWYSVGVVLYQALTGALPFSGVSRRVLIEKQMREPPPPSRRVAGIPARLDRLCASLLSLAPENRPGASEVLAALGRRSDAPSMRAPSIASRFVGRRSELAQLEDAFEAAKSGVPVMACVHGASGIGKTTLVRQFLDELAIEGEAVVLTGRCYERESVPYKALDSLIDALSNELRRLPRSDAEKLVPPDVHALVKLFPVLRRVQAIAEAPPRSFEVPDPQESRRRASAALGELIGRLSRLCPLVLAVDDLQWGDTDSAALIADLMRGSAGATLLVVSYRDEDVGTSPLLRALLADRALDGDVRRIALDALGEDEARELAASLLEDEGRAGDAAAIARESRGSPLFVHELVRHVSAGAAVGASEQPIVLDDVLAARVRELPAPARSLLQIVATAGGPVTLAVASRAAELAGEEQSALAVLRTERLIRSRGIRHADQIETFHDRIRHAVVGALGSDAKRHCHRRLVVALESAGSADPEVLVEHLLGAGERERAGQQAEIAADQARRALAFERAASWYRLALETRTLSPAERSRLLSKLGDALVDAGRGVDAAAAFRDALVGANTAAALELRRRRAEQLLRSGHLDEGLAAVREVLAAVGLELASTPGRALASLVLRRARIRVRGLGFVERDASELEPAELMRIDACWSVATAVGMTDFIRGADFQTRHLLLALDAGEPHRVARGLAVETAYSGGQGGPSSRRTAELARATRELSARLGSPHLEGLSVTVAGIAAFLQGRWQTARESCERGEAIFRERCSGVAWELASAQFFGLGARYYLGDVGELAERVPELLREAEARGDLYRATGLRSWRTNAAWLVRDDPEAARLQVDEAVRRWTRQGFHLQHYYEIFSLCQIDLYAGKPGAAYERVCASLDQLGRSMLLRIQNVRVEAHYLRARAALALSAERGVDHELLSVAERDARRIARERMPWSDPYARAIRAAIALQRGERGRASRQLEAALAGFEAQEMKLFAQAARKKLGELVGGERGATLAAEAGRSMASERIANPRRFAELLLSGFSTSRGVPD